MMPLDDFFNYVSLQDVQISPDGSAVVFTTRRPDWEHDRYRLDLWIARQDATPQLLTNSGRDSDPEWSPNGQWIAFTSSREAQSEGGPHCGGDQVFVISAAGGEASLVTCEANSVHAFTWSPDSRTLYFSTREPWDKSAHANYEKQWRDVVQYREADRGDVVEKTDIAAAVERAKGVVQSALKMCTTQPRSPPCPGRSMTSPSLMTEGLWRSVLARLPIVARNLRDYEIFFSRAMEEHLDNLRITMQQKAH